MELSQEFLIETFFSYCKRPIYKRYQNIFNAECPVCREGKSAGRSRRLFFFPSKNYLYCHNCSKSWNPFEWVREVTSLTIPEILKRNKSKTDSGTTISVNIKPQIVQKPVSDLPEDSIDLSDPAQIDFYKEERHVKLALDYCRERRLFTAANSCKKFFISLTDKVHKHRLVIPFYGSNNRVVCYQSRALTSKQFPKYLTKFGEKAVFGFDRINSEIPYVFVFEGPIDSMFVRNGVALASLSATDYQTNQLNSLIGYNVIYVFDNDKNNKQTSKKIEKHIKDGKTVFIWPKEFNKFKDFNEICCKLGLDEINWMFITKNSFKGSEALVKFKLSSNIFNT